MIGEALLIKAKKKKLNNKKPLRTLPGRIHKSYLGMNVPRIDFWMVLPVIILLTFGVLMVFSASYYTEISKGKSPYSLLVKNSILVIGGVISMMVTSFVDYKIYKKIFKSYSYYEFSSFTYGVYSFWSNN